MRFAVTARDAGSEARCGRLTTPHGAVETPVFMPVGTQATVKTLTPRQLREAGVDLLLCNAYHLMLRPGADRVASFGGLHAFMGWERPILTDSGGFQVFSLAALRCVQDEGVRFRSHVDGADWFLSPEVCIEAQRKLGADIIMPLDECVAFPAERDRAAQAMERSVTWASRCRQAHRGNHQALFGIVQGGTFRDLRLECTDRLRAMDFEGYAIGGLSVGEGPSLMREVLSYTAPALPGDRPRYLMGVGLPEDLVDAVSMGVDMFDCVIPTRNGRNGLAFTSVGRVKIRNRVHADSREPLDPDCDCPACGEFSRGYIRHLFQADEILGLTLMSLHNVRYFERLMERAREAIREGAFASFREQVRATYPSPLNPVNRSRPMVIAANGSPFPMWAFFAVIIAIFYLLILRPQKRKEQQRRGMIESLKKGARVVTIGGIFGTVTSVKENEIVLRVDDATGACLRVARSAVNRVVTDPKDADRKADDSDRDAERR